MQDKLYKRGRQLCCFYCCEGFFTLGLPLVLLSVSDDLVVELFSAIFANIQCMFFVEWLCESHALISRVANCPGNIQDIPKFFLPRSWKSVFCAIVPEIWKQE